MSIRKRKQSLIEDECLACLGYFAYATRRTTRKRLTMAFARSTRLDQESKGSREGWWQFKFDNIHCAFKELEGKRIHSREIPKTEKQGAKSSEGVQQAIKDGALRLFLNDFETCVECALAALDKSLPADDHEAIFGGVDSGAQAPYFRSAASQAASEAIDGRKPEGVRKLRQHWYMERDSDLPKAAKEAFKKDHGELFCEICGVRPEPTYGHAIIDAHHRLPLSKYAERMKTHTEPSDFAILCPSCHRAVHKQKDCDMDRVSERISSTGVKFRRPQGPS
jgi:hypothetical protein